MHAVRGQSHSPDRIDPLAAAFLQHVPQPTSDATLQNLTAVGEQIKDVDQISLRVDHRFTSGDQLFARFSTFDASEIQPFGMSTLQETLVPGFGATWAPRPGTLVSATRICSDAPL